ARRIHRRPRRQLRLDDARRGRLSLRHRSDARARRARDGSTAVRDDAVLGDGRPESVAGLRHRRVGFDLEAPPEGRVLEYVVGGGGHARLATGSLVEEIERLRAEPADDDIEVEPLAKWSGSEVRARIG